MVFSVYSTVFTFRTNRKKLEQANPHWSLVGLWYYGLFFFWFVAATVLLSFVGMFAWVIVR